MREHFKPIGIPALAFIIATAFSPGDRTPLPPSITRVMPAPRIDGVITSAEQATVSGVRVIRAGTATLIGNNLIPREGTAGLQGGPWVVKLGALTLRVVGTNVGKRGDLRGAGEPDSVLVTLPDLPDNVVGPFSVEVDGQLATTVSSFVLATRPRVNQFVEVTSDARGVQPIVNQTLTRGRLYQITGSWLSVRGTTQLLQAGTVRIGTHTMLMQPTADPVTQLRFVVPQDAATGTLVVSTLGGVTTIGLFNVADSAAGRIATPRVTGLSISSESVPAGGSATGTVVLDLPGATVDGFTVALSSSHPNVARVLETLSMRGTSTTFSIVTTSVATPQRVTITATAGGAKQSRTFTVTPP